MVTIIDTSFIVIIILAITDIIHLITIVSIKGQKQKSYWHRNVI